MTRPVPWLLREADAGQAQRLEEKLGVHPVIARVLVARGFGEEQAAARHLAPRLGDLLPPTGMAGMEAAAARLGQAVSEGELIGVFGDYDVDGVSSMVLVADYLRRLEARTTLRVARRDEGYGFGPGPAREMIARGCKLLVLTDCGTSDHAAVSEAAGAGVDVVAVDHHQVTRAEWPGLALINPHQPGCGFPFKHLTSVGLAFYVAASLRRFLERQGRRAPDPRDTLDLVALGTIADVAPLEAENRILVARGLSQLAHTQRPGLRELLRICNLAGRVPTADEVGWRIGPRLNAPGRLGDASVSMDCLWLTDEEQGAQRARECDALNEQRKQIQTRVEEEAVAQAEKQRDRAFILVAGEGWHPGVIGIVAARLVAKLERPAGVVALGAGEARGSARSVPGIHLVDLFRPCAELLVRFGGHAAAAGFSVLPERIEDLGRALHDAALPLARSLEVRPLAVDGAIDLSIVDLAFCGELGRLGPHGCGNPAPVFAATHVEVESTRPMGQDHVRLVVRSGEAVRVAVGFGMGDRPVQRGDHLDIAFVPEVDDFQGPRVRLRLMDLRPAGEGLGASTSDAAGASRRSR